MMVLQVKDDGVGMDEETCARILSDGFKAVFPKGIPI